MNLNWQLDSFENLTPKVLYGLMRLRQVVFVVEQTCPYADLDGLDPECLHLAACQNDVPVAYLRIVPPHLHPSGLPSLGRICNAASVRGRGVGRELVIRGLRAIDERYPGMPCQIGAQSYLRQFYESFGFAVNGPEYDEDGIMHFPMRRPGS